MLEIVNRIINKKNISCWLYAYISIIIIAVSILFVYSISDGAIFPVQEDESTYYNSARLYNETGSLKAFSCISEQRSLMGEHNWYGPAYHIIYGSVAKIFGFNNYFFIIVHYFIFLASVFACFLLNLSRLKQLFFISIFLSSYVSYSFIFTYYPELFHVFFSIILLVIYSRLKDNPQLIYLFIFLIIVFSLIRITSIFWILTLLFIRKGVLGFKLRLSVILILFVFILFYLKYYTAPAYSGIVGLHNLHNGNYGVFNLWNTIKIIITQSFVNIDIMYKTANGSVLFVLLFFIVTIISLFSYSAGENYLTLWGLFIVAILAFSALILLYTTNSFYFEKQIAFLVPILIFVIISTGYNIPLLFCTGAFIFFPLSINKAQNNIYSRREFYQNLQKHKKYIESWGDIRKHIVARNSEINILIAYTEYSDIPLNMTICFLPASVSGTPVLYSSNIVDANAPVVELFKMYNRIRIDYIVSKKIIDIPRTKLIYSNSYYYLYENL